MLSAFPTFLSYNQLSPFLIRLVLGFIFVFWAYRALRNVGAKMDQKAIGIIEGVAGILLVIGLWTQVAALVVFVDLVIRLVERIMKKAFLTDGVNYYLVLLVMAISLMVTGAGWIAFDLPL
jgi:uncharacterized membrane protein YphA (DoxX/SURF4 family)